MDLSERPESSLRRHPWEVARARFFLDLVPSSPGRVLDVGAGDAYLSRRLLAERPTAEIVCQDLNYSGDDLEALRADTPPGLRFVQDLPEGVFDTLVLLDVLEHVPDDRAFMGELLPRLSPTGRLLFSVPAWPLLYSSHDRMLAHHRRYTPGVARSVLTSAGLRILRSGGLFHSLLAPRALQVGLERLRGPQGQRDLGWNAGRALSAGVDAALAADTWLSRRLARSPVELPGLSWWALCARGAESG